ncbi:MAG: bifunctional hydroxymethylpyrimidine kinase/phosphomethylpyrimidine kinase, partial [Methanomassiliicoccus sp.]
MAVVLSIAGSDPIGGAGIEADIKAIASMGAHGAVALSAITAQNTVEVLDMFPLPPEQIISQINAVLEDVKPDAVKTGMLHSAGTVKAISPLLKELGVPLVIDPVLFAGVGTALHQEDLADALAKDLFPIATVITPNKEEAEALSGMVITNGDSLDRVGRRLLKMGAEAVLLKGGHLDGKMAVDTLYTKDEIYELASPRLDREVHGAGCTLSSFIACGLASGLTTKEAVKEAKRRIYDSIAMAVPVGRGSLCINPTATLYKEAMRPAVQEAVRSGVRVIEDRMPPQMVPEVGLTLAYALPYPQGYGEVCGVEGRLVRTGDRVCRVGEVRFGGSRHIARVVMAAQAFDPEARCAMNLRFSEENVKRLRRSGLVVASFDRAGEPEMVSSMEWGTAEAIK